MPTYRNDSTTEGYKLTAPGQSGEYVLRPGQTGASVRFVSVSDLTKTSDSPYWNPCESQGTRTVSSGERTVPLSDNCKKVRVQKVAGTTVTVYLQSSDNKPPIVKDWDASDPVVDCVVDGRASQVICEFAGSGSIQVVELKEDAELVPVTQTA